MRVQSKAKSQTLMLLSCSSSWWYQLTLSDYLQSHKTLSLVPSCNTGKKQCLTGIATPEANGGGSWMSLSSLTLTCAVQVLITRQFPYSKPSLTLGELFNTWLFQMLYQFIWYICKHDLQKIKHSRLTNSLLAIEIIKDMHPLQKQTIQTIQPCTCNWSITKQPKDVKCPLCLKHSFKQIPQET